MILSWILGTRSETWRIWKSTQSAFDCFTRRSVSKGTINVSLLVFFARIKCHHKNIGSDSGSGFAYSNKVRDEAYIYEHIWTCILRTISLTYVSHTLKPNKIYEAVHASLHAKCAIPLKRAPKCDCTKYRVVCSRQRVYSEIIMSILIACGVER